MSQKNIALAGKIIEIYEKNIFYLPIRKAGHFFSRAYKVTGNEKYKNILAWFIFIDKAGRIRQAADRLRKRKFKYKKKSLKGIEERKAQRIVFYEKNPKASFFDKLLISLFYIKKFNLHDSVFKKEFAEIVRLLKKENFEKTYLTERAIKLNSSYTFNTVFLLKHLRVDESICRKAEDLLRKIYLTPDLKLKKDLPTAEFLSLIYSLTHIIIADSKYYERHVVGHEWILKFFSENIDLIIQKVYLDIIAEVAFCFQLCQKKKKYKKAYQTVLTHLKKNFNPAELLPDIEYLLEKEHTASILMLLFSDKKRFFRGPDLSGHKIFDKLNRKINK